MNQDNNKNENIEIQGLLKSYLRFRSSAGKNGSEAGNHLDEDTLAAFVEGDLTRRENDFLVGHLVDCSFCLHRTAELSQLREAFEEEPLAIVSDGAQPAKVSEVLSNLFGRLFGSSEGVVFAHEEKPEENKEEKNDDEPSADGSSENSDETKS